MSNDGLTKAERSKLIEPCSDCRRLPDVAWALRNRDGITVKLDCSDCGRWQTAALADSADPTARSTWKEA